MATARAHHYRFAHRLLPQVTASFGPRLLDEPPPAGLDTALTRMWTRLGTELPPDAAALPADGLHGQRLEHAGHDVLLIAFPTPIAPPEAHFAAIVRAAPATPCRYLTLELTVDVLTHRTATVLGEWTADGHLNFGAGPADPPTPDAFLTALERLLAAR